MKKKVQKRPFATKLSQDFFNKFSDYAAVTGLKLNYIIEKAVNEYINKYPPQNEDKPQSEDTA